jgi:hypothetical protein
VISERRRAAIASCHDEYVFESLMHHIGNAVGVWMYVIAGGLAFSEAAILVGFVLPGEIALLVAGYFCRYGPLNVWVMAAVAVCCAIAGDSVGSNSVATSAGRCGARASAPGSAHIGGRRSTASCTGTAARRSSSAGLPRCCGR